MRRVIGLGFRARAGKDTVASVIARVHNASIIAFADPLKGAAKVIFGWTDKHVYGDLKEIVDPFWGFTPRWALQKLGTEAVREVIGQDVWERAARRRIEASVDHVIVTDVRFPNEAKMIKDLGGELWHIDRSCLPQATHVSETAMERWTQWDRVLRNNGTLADLEHQALAAFAEACG